MFWCSLTLFLDVWNSQSCECSHSIICQCCVEWKYFMFCSSELEDRSAFVKKHFWYCHVQFVSLTGNQRFVSARTSCVCFAGLNTILLNNWYYFVGVSPWTLERRYQLSSLKLELVVFVILRPVDHNFWNIPVYRTFRCFAKDYYSGLKLLYFVPGYQETTTVKIKLDWLQQCCQDPISNII